MSTDVEQYRAGFEAWARDNRYDLTKCGEGSRIGPADSYKNTATAHAWEVWTASKRESSAEPSSLCEGAVPVPYTVDMARMMLALGHRYLSENAPEHLAKREASTEPSAIPDVLFDGSSVYDEIVRVNGHRPHYVVSDTLDAVVRLMRKAGAGALPGSTDPSAPQEFGEPIGKTHTCGARGEYFGTCPQCAGVGAHTKAGSEK